MTEPIPAADPTGSDTTAHPARGLIRRLGGPTKVGKALGLEQTAVSNWGNRGIPAKRMPAIRELASSLGVELSEKELDSAINWG